MREKFFLRSLGKRGYLLHVGGDCYAEGTQDTESMSKLTPSQAMRDYWRELPIYRKVVRRMSLYRDVIDATFDEDWGTPEWGTDEDKQDTIERTLDIIDRLKRYLDEFAEYLRKEQN